MGQIIVRKFIRRNYVIVEFLRIFRETMEFVDEKLGQQFNAFKKKKSKVKLEDIV